jgi:hypothetical protein
VTGQETPPQGVVLTVDGRQFPCDVLREPGQDRGGCAAWLAVPREPLPVVTDKDMVLNATLIPAMSILIIAVPLED